MIATVKLQHFLEAVMSIRDSRSIFRFTLLVLAFFPPSSVYAQFSASLAGTVQDTSGAIVPKATVTLTNLGTQQTQTATTSDTGFYRFNELPPAYYKLMVTATGFKTANFDDISLAAESPRNRTLKWP